MGTYDPRIVVQALEDLEDELTRWSFMACDMLTTAAFSQRQGREAVDRALHQAAVLRHRAGEDEEKVEKARSSVVMAIEKCSNARNAALNTLTGSQAGLAESNATLQKWQMELKKALSWLARAEAKLENAVQERNRAQTALSSAEWNLSQAEASLRVCQNNGNRRDCRNEALTVDRAKAEIVRSKQLVAAAEQKVAAAEAEVEEAKVRVVGCKNAIAFSTDAVSLAQKVVSSATQAVNAAERSLEHAQAAERFMRVAQERMWAEVASTENMTAMAKAAQDSANEAAFYFQTADNAGSTAQTYVTSVRGELGYRIQTLWEFNQTGKLESAD